MIGRILAAAAAGFHPLQLVFLTAVNVLDTGLPKPDSSVDEPRLELRAREIKLPAELLLFLLARVRVEYVSPEPLLQRFGCVSRKGGPFLFGRRAITIGSSALTTTGCCCCGGGGGVTPNTRSAAWL